MPLPCPLTIASPHRRIAGMASNRRRRLVLQLVIRVTAEPDFYPDFLELEAPPPPGTAVEIDGASFVVEALSLKSQEYPSGRRSYYTATLRRS